MNYGKFFKLNLTESIDGVTIYDYVDLPAYFGENKLISPKYPISVVITGTTVRFRLHYCAYKFSDGNYAYNVLDNEEVASAKTVHLDEVILELPYAENKMEPVSSVLPHIFSARFPLLVATDSIENDENVYLSQLLNRRYGKHEREDNPDADMRMYEELRNSIDKDRTFSTIWLMGLRENNVDESAFINLKDSDGRFYIGFLRKLVLDFMFDLKHTDVFQNSSDYERMHSGLMEDFMFSALMHKCEYYYNRGLIVDAIDKAARHGNPVEEKNNIRLLYVPKLFESESTWIDDIMNPQAERVFGNSAVVYSGSNAKEIIRKRLSTVFSPIRLRSDACDYWFADPEEELRRVYFTMRGKNEEKHLCNSETVTEYINLPDKRTVHAQRSRISRWFLQRNSFVDSFHVHFPRFVDYVLPAFIVALTVLAVSRGELWTKEFWSGRYFQVFNTIVGVAGFIAAASIILMSWHSRKGRTLSIAKLHLVGKRLLWWSIWTGTALCAVLCLYKYGAHVAFWILAGTSLLTFLSGPIWANVRIVQNVHLTYPRLIASIAAAWFTLVIGNELLISFFDVIPSGLACTLLSVIVFIFVLYDMNRDLPSAPATVKFARSLGVICVSLCISIVIGVFVINFVGERFLERSGNLGSVTTALSEKDLATYQEVYGQTLTLPKSESGPIAEVGHLSKLEQGQVGRVSGRGKKVISEKKYPIATVWTFANGYRLFILNGLLIQFAFLAMFIGVFIQMLFEEKNLNEL